MHMISKLSWTPVRVVRFAAVLIAGFALVANTGIPAHAAFIGDYAPDKFTQVDVNSDGTAVTPDGGLTVMLTGGNNGSGFPGWTYLLMTAPANLLISFHYSFSPDAWDQVFGDPTFGPGDFGGYFAKGKLWPLTAGLVQTTVEGTTAFAVSAGEGFGFGIQTVDNLGGPATLVISDFEARAAVATPEPGFAPAVLIVCGTLIFIRRRIGRTA